MTQDLAQRVRDAIADRGVVWIAESRGTDVLLVAASSAGIDSAIGALEGVRAPDWVVTSPPRFRGQPISLRLENAPLEDVLAFYSNLTGSPYAPDGDTDAWVRASIVDVPSDESLAAILDANRLGTTDAGSRILVGPAKVETIDVPVRHLSAAAMDPLNALVEQTPSISDAPSVVSFRGDKVRIEARADVAENLAALVRTLDALLAD